MKVDRSRLPQAIWEFVVMADTHYMLPEKADLGDFETRRYQTERIARSLDIAAALQPEFVLHLGDLVQEYPGTKDFPESLRQALAQLKSSGLEIRQVAGNHDVGDKPDPSTLAPWVNDEFLSHYHEVAGDSWFGFDHGDLHFIVLNSMIMNTGMPEEQEQWKWLEADLVENQAKRLIVGLHIAPFLKSPHEASLGHYDNIAEPARSKLLSLCHTHGVEVVFAGHSHFAFYNRFGGTDYYVVPSTSTTRPGFSEVFSSGPPPARGHNDADKLGFFLVRVYEEGISTHLIRINGLASYPQPSADKAILVHAPSPLVDSARWGVSLRHSLTSFTSVPVGEPNLVQQTVRNDYPLLSLIESGARHVRAPIRDVLAEENRSQYLALKEHGVEITAVEVMDEVGAAAERIKDGADLIDLVEVQLVEDRTEGKNVDFDAVKRLTEISDTPVAISKVGIGTIEGTRMHPSHKIGWDPDDLDAVSEVLKTTGTTRAVTTVKTRDDLIRLLGALARNEQSAPDLDVVAPIGNTGRMRDAWLACEAIFSLSAHANTRTLVDTLVELDRTHYLHGGLLDRMCNPTAAFKPIQSCATVVYGQRGDEYTEVDSTNFGATLSSANGTTLALVIPGLTPEARPDIEAFVSGNRVTKRYDLGAGTSWTPSSEREAYWPSHDANEPWILECEVAK